MAKNVATSLDVAKLAGVSQSAVSRVFTPGASASKKTIEKVKIAAKELGYRPNVLARSLTTGRSRIIGLVVAYLENQFYPQALELLSKALQQKGYHVLVFMVSQTRGNIDEILQEILDYQADGIVMASVAMSSELAEYCQSAGVPVVLFNRSHDDERLSAVTTDNHEGGRKVADYLVRSGHKRIAYIAGWEGASTQRDREQGFLDGLQSAGQTVFKREVGNFLHEDAIAATKRLFEGPTNPDAVFVANDHMAFAVMDTIRDTLGLKIPEDVSVVGYDDVPIAAWPAYSLTTVRQPCNRMVAETVDILMSGINAHQANGGACEVRKTQIEGPLIIRGSSR
ncbi:MAG: LacI family DNA-binding transcriptional regulator [Alphaproteobacteria bacterium]